MERSNIIDFSASMLPQCIRVVRNVSYLPQHQEASSGLVCLTALYYLTLRRSSSRATIILCRSFSERSIRKVPSIL